MSSVLDRGTGSLTGRLWKAVRVGSLALLAAGGCTKRDAVIVGPPPGTASEEQGKATLQAAHHWIIKLSTVASEKATKPDVRRLAKLLRAEHERALGQLETLIALEGARLLYPYGAIDAGAPPWRDPAAHGLEGVSGTAFDDRFLRLMMEGHQELLLAIDVVDRFPTARGRLRQVLQDGRAIEAQHLEIAVALFTRLGLGAVVY
jgi:predicted outer membrane protein